MALQKTHIDNDGRGDGGTQTPAGVSPRTGMTLVELLVAITVVTLLMAVAVPLVRESLDQDRTREAARQLNMALSSARTRAIERGRPCGVWLQRAEANPDACVEVFFAESPPPYTGDVMGARVYLGDSAPTDSIADFIAFDMRCTNFFNSISVGDVIRFQGIGHYYIITSLDNTPGLLNGDMFMPYVGRAGFSRAYLESPWPALTQYLNLPAAQRPNAGLTFEVLRHPRRLNTTSLQLPEGTVVDLRFSGVGAEGTQFAFSSGDADHVILGFNPAGAMSYLYFDNAPQNVDGPAHLLVGKFDQIQDADSTPESPNPISYDSSGAITVTFDKNVSSPDSLWVTVGSRNGTITSSENAWELRPAAGWSGVPGPPYFANTIRRAREFAQGGDAMGGR